MIPQIDMTYDQNAIALLVVVKVVPRIPILEKGHDDERSVIKNVSAKELCLKIAINLNSSRLRNRKNYVTVRRM